MNELQAGGLPNLQAIAKACGKPLDADQLRFVANSLSQEGNHCGQAVPGSGKTTCLVVMILYLMRQMRVPDDKIICLSFNRSTADMLRERIGRATNRNPAAYMQLSRTYHGLGKAACAKIEPEPRTEFIDRTLQFIGLSMRTWNDTERDNYPCDAPTAAAAIGLMKNVGCYVRWTPSPVTHIEPRAMTLMPWLHERHMQRMLEKYEAVKSKALDYEDYLVVPWLEWQKGHNPFSNKAFSGVEWLLVDELQDANLPQFRMIEALLDATGGRCRVIGVGDDGQSIYGWRGAGVHSMDDFVERFKAQRHRVAFNYRSTRQVVDAALVVAKNRQANADLQIVPVREDAGAVYEVASNNPESEARAVLALIKRLHESYAYNEMLVLSRTNAVLSAVARSVWQAGVPVVCTSVAESGPELINAVAAVLRHPNADIRRVLCAMKFVGQRTADAVCMAGYTLEAMQPHNVASRTLRKKIEELHAKMLGFQREAFAARAQTDANGFRRLVESCQEMLTDFGIDYSAATGNNLAAEMDAAARFLLGLAENHGTQKALDMAFQLYDSDITQERQNAVRFSTVHRAKGQESRVVIVTDGDNFPCILVDPSDELYEQEINLLYVAVTRGMDMVFISRWPRMVDGLAVRSRLYHGIKWTGRLAFEHDGQFTRLVQQAVALPQRKLRPAGAPHGDAHQAAGGWPEPVDQQCSGPTLMRFAADLQAAFKSTGGKLHTHLPAAQQNEPPAQSDLFGHQAVAAGAFDALYTEHATAMNLRAPREVKMEWLKSASKALAVALGGGWTPDVHDPEPPVQRIRVQFDRLWPVADMQGPWVPNNGAAVDVLSVVLEISGNKRLMPTIRLCGSRVSTWLDMRADRVYKLGRVESRPLFGPMSLWLWRGGDYARSREEGFAACLRELLGQLSTAKDAAEWIAQQPAMPAGDFWPLPVGGHMWVRTAYDRLWPFHPPAVDLLLPSDMVNVRPTQRDFEADRKLEVWRRWIDEWIKGCRPQVDVERWAGLNRVMLERVPDEAQEWAVATACGVSASAVNLHATGVMRTFNMPPDDNIRWPCGDFISSLTQAFGVPCTVRGVPAQGAQGR